MTEISKTKKRPVKPSTINRDTANLRAMLNKAVNYSKLEYNPLGRIKQLEENNVRERVLNQDEVVISFLADRELIVEVMRLME